MRTTGEVYQGSLSPLAFVLDVTPSDSASVGGVPDLSVVTAASFRVYLPDGTSATWTATMTRQTATTLRLTHAYASGNLSQTGRYVIFADLTTPDGTEPCEPVTLVVKAAR